MANGRDLERLWEKAVANGTYSGKTVHPFGDFVTGQLVTHILAKMVAVLCDKMVSISIVVY
jgi:SAM-dependent MidA family methyltransferase